MQKNTNAFFREYQNLIDQKSLTKLNDTLFDKFFPWFFFNSSVDNVDNKNNLFYSPAILRHCFVLDGKIGSEWFQLITPILESMTELFQSDIELINAHANLLMPSAAVTDQMDIPHVDLDSSPDNSYTAIFYIHDCTESTVLYNETVVNNADINVADVTVRSRIIPVKNKISIWRTSVIHSAPGSVSKARIVINLNFNILNQNIVDKIK